MYFIADICSSNSQCKADFIKMNSVPLSIPETGCFSHEYHYAIPSEQPMGRAGVQYIFRTYHGVL